METIIKELEGTWEEVLTYDPELKGKHVRLQVVERDNSTLGSLLKHAGTWSGDDFEECLQTVYDNRTESRF